MGRRHERPRTRQGFPRTLLRQRRHLDNAGSRRSAKAAWLQALVQWSTPDDVMTIIMMIIIRPHLMQTAPLRSQLRRAAAARRYQISPSAYGAAER